MQEGVMRGTRNALSLIRLAVAVTAVALAPWAWADLGPGEFEAALVRCADVNRPAALAGCGADPLQAGKAEIRPDGRVEVEVEGAAPNASYAAFLRSPDGGAQLLLGTLATNGSGEGELHVVGVFPPGAVGAGNVVLRRLALDQFVTGFALAAASARHDGDDTDNDHEGGERKFEAVLVRCAAVNTPAALAACGTDPLLGGEAEIDDEGRVEVEVAGAAPGASYAVVYRSLDGTVDLALGTLTTNAAGSGELKVGGVFLPGHVGAGTVVLRRLGADQFVTGFQVLGVRPRGFEAAIVGCAEVNTPAALTACGTDPLRTGKADIRLDGRVKVEIVGAAPNATYTLLLRSPDGTTDETLGTLTTNPAGNGQLKVVGVFVPGDVGAGNLVLRRTDADQFFSGFRVRTSHARRLEGALVSCAAVTRPGALAGCGTDPLLGGEVEIRPDGRVDLEVVGAAPSASYDVVLLAVNGAAELALGTLATNAAGHGALKVRGVFVQDGVGAGSVVLRRAGADQFVTGFRVQAFDVSDGHWAKRWVEGLFAARVTGGCASDPLLYCPESQVTRAQMAVFLLRGEHGAAFVPPAPGGRFRDVPAQHWAAGWIEQLAAEGVTTGCGSQSFCPESPLTRAQMALFLLLAKHGTAYRPPAPTGLFADVPGGYWAAAWIEQLAREGITAGCRPGGFCPDEPVTRAQMAVFLLRTFGSV